VVAYHPIWRCARGPRSPWGESHRAGVNEGRPPVDFDFDLGSNSPLIVYPHYRDSVHLLAGRRHSQGLSAGVGGLFRPICATLTSIASRPAGRGRARRLSRAGEQHGQLRSDGRNIGCRCSADFRMLTDYAADNIWLVGIPRRWRSLSEEPCRLDHISQRRPAQGVNGCARAVRPSRAAGGKHGIVAIDGHRIDAAYRSSPCHDGQTKRRATRVALTLADNSAKELVLADYF